MNKKRVSISLDQDIYDKIEKQRGHLVKRSPFINDILKKKLEEKK